MRAGRDLPRHAIAPEKLAEIFLEAFRRGWSQGLFVTSGIPKNPVWAMDRMIALVELLRFRHRFAGYIHAKAVAGCRPDQVDRLALLVDRLSYNLESVCQKTLDRVAPEKSLSAGLDLMRRAKRAAGEGAPRVAGDPRPPGPHLRAGITTQIVVGLDERNDRELLRETFGLWRERTIHHPQFAAFRPISETPLEDRPETPALREHRLYQADHLLRRYGFEPSELPFDEREIFRSTAIRRWRGRSRTPRFFRWRSRPRRGRRCAAFPAWGLAGVERILANESAGLARGRRPRKARRDRVTRGGVSLVSGKAPFDLSGTEAALRRRSARSPASRLLFFARNVPVTHPGSPRLALRSMSVLSPARAGWIEDRGAVLLSEHPRFQTRPWGS